MADQKIYHAPHLDLQKLARAIAEWFQGQQFEAQILPAPGKGVAVQARKVDTLRTVTGTSEALNVMLTRQGNNLLVQTGAAAWADKAVVGTVGLFAFWPALIPAAYGFWKQRQLPQEVFQFIEQYIILGEDADIVFDTFPSSAPKAQEAQADARCPSCNQSVREGAKFCDNCGASLTLLCAQCGASLRPSAKFCDNCGAPLEPKTPL